MSRTVLHRDRAGHLPADPDDRTDDRDADRPASARPDEWSRPDLHDPSGGMASPRWVDNALTPTSPPSGRRSDPAKEVSLSISVPPTVDPARLARIARLESGRHVANEEGRVCLMEAVAYVTDQPWGDAPDKAA